LVSRTLGGQLLRSATSVAANYRAACRARSRREFIAKISLVIEEADETVFWLEMLSGAGLVETKVAGVLTQEFDELLAVMIVSRITARRRMQNGAGS
jgi:four helix bundle protein